MDAGQAEPDGIAAGVHALPPPPQRPHWANGVVVLGLVWIAAFLPLLATIFADGFCLEDTCTPEDATARSLLAWTVLLVTLVTMIGVIVWMRQRVWVWIGVTALVVGGLTVLSLTVADARVNSDNCTVLAGQPSTCTFQSAISDRWEWLLIGSAAVVGAVVLSVMAIRRDR
jgi:hypothetical protein